MQLPSYLQNIPGVILPDGTINWQLIQSITGQNTEFLRLLVGDKAEAPAGLVDTNQQTPINYLTGPQTSNILEGGVTLQQLLNLPQQTTQPAAPAPTPAPPATPQNNLPPQPQIPANMGPPSAANNTPQNGPVLSFNNPFYNSVISPVLNSDGQQIGTTPLANNQFATPSTAQGLLDYYSALGYKDGRINTSQYSGPTAPSQAELGIQFGNSPVINAGLEYTRLQNSNNYSPQYLASQFKDTLQPGSSGWNNYANGGQSMNSAQAEKAYGGNPAYDPNANALGQSMKYPGGTSNPLNNPSTNNQFNTSSFTNPNPTTTTPRSSYNNTSIPGWRSLNSGVTTRGMTGALNNRGY